MEIRSARASDRGAILSLWLDLIEHHRRLDPGYPSLPGARERLLAEIARGLRMNSCCIGMAEAEGKPIGFVFAEVCRSDRPAQAGAGESWIHELYVDPDWRQRGVGDALVKHADAFFRERGVDSLSVRVEVANQDATRFWAARGFRDRARVLTRE